jgi:hypothetical protein
MPTTTTTTTTTNNQTISEEIARLRQLIEEKISGQTDQITTTGRPLIGSVSSSGVGGAATRRSAMIVPSRQQTRIDTHLPLSVAHTESHIQPYSQDLGERVTDLQLAVNRLHQDVSAIRQVVERMSPLSASLILGRTAGRK